MNIPETTLPIRIRAMTPSDLEQVQAIDRASFTLPWPVSAYRHEIENNQLSLCFVAERAADSPDTPDVDPRVADQQEVVGQHIVGQRIVGLIVVWLILGEAHIATIATHPDYRQQGIARRLLTETLRQCQQRQASSATLEVRASNLAAQELYTRFGFEVVGRRRRYYRDNQEDALLMTLYDLDEAYIHWLERKFSPSTQR